VTQKSVVDGEKQLPAQDSVAIYSRSILIKEALEMENIRRIGCPQPDMGRDDGDKRDDYCEREEESKLRWLPARLTATRKLIC
jgi:hypothetical protein